MENCDKATTILSNEHKNISKVVEVLTAECNKLDSGSEIDKVFFEKAVDFIQNYADKYHHAKEEDILFTELNKDDVQMHCDPIPQMLHEHDVGRNFVKGVIEGVSGNETSKVLEGTRGYIDLIKEHIYKEDNILYPMADEALNDVSQESLSSKFKEVEEKFVNGPKERCLAIVKEFEDRIK